eukprot:549814-Amphidinium_carterae.1
MSGFTHSQEARSDVALNHMYSVAQGVGTSRMDHHARYAMCMPGHLLNALVLTGPIFIGSDDLGHSFEHSSKLLVVQCWRLYFLA